jgi:rSAM/selenodomain-associated transferase 1
VQHGRHPQLPSSAHARSGRQIVKPVAVVIMAKAPQTGEVKTRLSPPLSPTDAAKLYRCFLLDKIEQVTALEAATLALAFTPPEAKGFFEDVAPGFVLVQQRGADLGDRLANSLGELIAGGHRAAVAIDSDTPTLPVSFLQQAVDLLTTSDVDLVLGPTQDGGYYLIGLRAMHRELFEAMAWSTSTVLSETIQRASAKGLRVACLPPWYDIDTPEDLGRLRAELASGGITTASHTFEFLLEPTG